MIITASDYGYKKYSGAQILSTHAILDPISEPFWTKDMT